MGKSPLLVLAAAFFLIGCETESTVEGLWVVKSVTVGEENMTPNARWMRFNPDFTQQSGNGWMQHSIGTWKLDPSKQALTIINTNGLDDSSDPFAVSISGNEMVWKRMEEGESVEVNLERATQLPTTYGDQLLGLWELEKASGRYSTKSGETIALDYLFFRWDNGFVMGTAKGRIRGNYIVDRHNPEVDLIPFDAEYSRASWKIDFEDNGITLSLLNTDSVVTRTFRRTHEFPHE